MWSTGLKLVHELSLLVHLGDKQQNELKRSALLLINDLQRPAVLRLTCGVVAGLLLPLVTWLLLDEAAPSAGTFVMTLVSLFGLIAGELLERSLFFTAVSAPRMPGAFA
jgi:hypothetical protein